MEVAVIPALNLVQDVNWSHNMMVIAVAKNSVVRSNLVHAHSDQSVIQQFNVVKCCDLENEDVDELYVTLPDWNKEDSSVETVYHVMFDTGTCVLVVYDFRLCLQLQTLSRLHLI